MKTVLVTGGAGFIGSHTCLRLLEEGLDVFVIDSFVNSNKQSLHKVLKIFSDSFKDKQNKIHIYEGDIRDKNLLIKIFEEAKKLKKTIDGVIHFAGLKSVKESCKDPLLYWNNNLIGTISLLKIMEEFNCRKLIFSSSATVYKYNSNKLINENEKLNPSNPYGQTKLAIEKILYDLYNKKEDKWKIISLRYFNPVGAHPSGLIGECPNGIPNNIFPYICGVAIGKFDYLKIFGNDWPTHDGTGIRDFIHVMDLAKAHTLALNHLKKLELGTILIFWRASKFLVKDILKKLFGFFGFSSILILFLNY